MFFIVSLRLVFNLKFRFRRAINNSFVNEFVRTMRCSEAAVSYSRGFVFRAADIVFK